MWQAQVALFIVLTTEAVTVQIFNEFWPKRDFVDQLRRTLYECQLYVAKSHGY